MGKPNIKELSSKELKDRLVQWRQPPYRAGQIQRWLFQKGTTSFAEMTNLSVELRSLLEQEFTIGRLQTVRSSLSIDGTVKFLFGLNDGLTIESVLIPDRAGLLCVYPPRRAAASAATFAPRPR